VHAFGEPSNVQGELEVLAHGIAEECQGLPLALKVIGRAMYGKTSPELQWELVLKKLRQSRMQERTVEEELYECLKLGYDVLSEDDERLKDCFLHFAAFPEDHELIFEDIFCHWVGEGWIPRNGEDDPRADAFTLLKKLCERSLIESIQLEEEFAVTDETLCAFKIHDVMRDVAFYILKNNSGVPSGELLYLYQPGQNLKFLPQGLEGTLEQPLKVRRLSLYQNKLQYLPENLYAPELVCLLLGANPMYNLDSSLNSFPKLRILDLRNGEFTSLPKEIGELEDLVYLDLSECFYLQTIPDTVRNLRKLKCLMIYSCSELKYLPSRVVGLTSLQKLDTKACGNLRWAEQTSSSTAGAEFPDHDYATNRASFKDICELSALTELSISEVVKIPHNISVLSNLKILFLKLLNSTLPANMPHWCIQLQQLEICNAGGLKYLPESFTRCGAFPALINLKMGCPGLVEFPEVEDGALSKLRILEFDYCYSLKTLPLSLNYLTSLKKLILYCCPKTLYESCMQNCEKATVWRTPIFTCFSIIDYL